MASGTIVERILVTIEADPANFIKNMLPVKKEVTTMSQDMAFNFRKVTKTSRDLMNNNTKVMTSTKKMGPVFHMEALSMMFGFQMMGRAVSSFASDSISTFMKITNGMTENGRALMQLSATWTFLKFTIGDAIAGALAPLIPMIVDLMMKISDWIDQNPELAGWLVIIGIGLLYLGWAASSLTLFFSALKYVILEAIPALITFTTGLDVAALSFWGIVGAFLVFLIIAALVVVAVYLLYKIWTNESSSTAEKVVASLMVITGFFLILFAIIGLWPLVLLMAVLMCIWLITLFHHRIANFFELLALNFVAMMQGWEISLTIGLINMLSTLKDWINKAIDLWNKWMPKQLQLPRMTAEDIVPTALLTHLHTVNASLAETVAKINELNKLRTTEEQPMDTIKRIMGFGKENPEEKTAPETLTGKAPGAPTTNQDMFAGYLAQLNAQKGGTQTNNFDFSGMEVGIDTDSITAQALNDREMAERLGKALADELASKTGSGTKK